MSTFYHFKLYFLFTKKSIKSSAVFKGGGTGGGAPHLNSKD